MMEEIMKVDLQIKVEIIIQIIQELIKRIILMFKKYQKIYKVQITIFLKIKMMMKKIKWLNLKKWLNNMQINKLQKLL